MCGLLTILKSLFEILLVPKLARPQAQPEPPRIVRSNFRPSDPIAQDRNPLADRDVCTTCLIESICTL